MNDQDPMQMTSKQVRDHCQLDDAYQKIMHQAVLDLGLTSADHDNVLRYAKTAANNAGYEWINTECLIPAITQHKGG